MSRGSAPIFTSFFSTECVTVPLPLTAATSSGLLIADVAGTGEPALLLAGDTDSICMLQSELSHARSIDFVKEIGQQRGMWIVCR